MIILMYTRVTARHHTQLFFNYLQWKRALALGTNLKIVFIRVFVHIITKCVFIYVSVWEQWTWWEMACDMVSLALHVAKCFLFFIFICVSLWNSKKVEGVWQGGGAEKDIWQEKRSQAACDSHAHTRAHKHTHALAVGWNAVNSSFSVRIFHTVAPFSQSGTGRKPSVPVVRFTHPVSPCVTSSSSSSPPT